MRFVKLLDVLGVLVALVVGFGAGALTAVQRGWGTMEMTVHLSNQTGQPVSRLIITTKNSTRTVTTHLGALAQGAETTSRVAVAGEGIYQIEATLADGRVITSSPAYVQSGYSAHERLQADKIESKVKFGL